MQTIRTTLWVSCLLAVPSLTRAAPPAGYVIQWGWNTAAGIPESTRVVASNAVAAVAEANHNLVLLQDRTLLGWGGNYHGEATGVANTNATYVPTAKSVRIKGAALSNVVSIAAGWSHSLALKADGTVVTWGQDSVPSAVADVTGIAAGYGSSWVLKRDGTIVAWGRMVTGLYSPEPPPGLSNVVAIAAGPRASCLAITTNPAVAARFMSK